jgi:hypothetical protein
LLDESMTPGWQWVAIDTVYSLFTRDEGFCLLMSHIEDTPFTIEQPHNTKKHKLLYGYMKNPWVPWVWVFGGYGWGSAQKYPGVTHAIH